MPMLMYQAWLGLNFSPYLQLRPNLYVSSEGSAVCAFIA